MRGFENGCEIPVAQLLITPTLVTVVGHLAPDESPAEIANLPAASSAIHQLSFTVLKGHTIPLSILVPFRTTFEALCWWSSRLILVNKLLVPFYGPRHNDPI